MKKQDTQVGHEKMQEHFFNFSPVELSQDGKSSVVEVLRVGIIRDRGLKITRQMLEDYVQNFKDGVYGTDLQVNLGHNRDGEAAGWIKELFLDGESLMARVEWTELGQEKVGKKLYQFVSSELAPSYPHAETGKSIDNVFIGLALTNVPALKNQRPVVLSEDEFNSQNTLRMFKTILTELQGREKLSEVDVKMLRTLLSELPEEEKTAAEGDVAALEAKQDEQAAADAKAAEEAKAAADAAEAAKLEAAKAAGASEALKEKGQEGVVSLSEFNAMKEKLETKELSEFVTSKVILSSEVSTGLMEEEKEAVTTFLKELTAEQRETFVALMGKVKHVDLSVRGFEAPSSAKNGSYEEKVVALSEQLVKEGKAKNIEEAQKMAAKTLNS